LPEVKQWPDARILPPAGLISGKVAPRGAAMMVAGKAALTSKPMARSAPAVHARPELVPLSADKIHCAHCAVRGRCLPATLDGEHLRCFDELVGSQLRLRKRTALFVAGDDFRALYLIRSGSCMTSILDEDGREQVIGHHMPGDVVGLDGIAASRHTCTAMAVEDAEVCAVSFDRLEALAVAISPLQQQVRNAMAREMRRSQAHMLLLGSLRAEERVAVFLLDLAQRHQQRGDSASELDLRMSRAEIGSYLGLQLETVSRLLTRFHLEGLIHVQGRAVKLLDTVALTGLVGRRG
jgi:CRP/FNR family transcriptional regulator, anaerobic regulatory protein